MQCYKDGNEEKKELKKNYPCLIRLGIDNKKTTSFLSCIATIYDEYILKKNITDERETQLKNISSSNSEKLIKILKKKITLDIFITLQNGNLIDLFYKKKDISNSYILKYKRTNIYKKTVLKKINKSKEFMKYIILSYENFVKYLTDDDKINYEFIWDLICEPTSKNGVLFKTGINLIILKNSKDGIIDKIELICPKKNYSKNIFDSSRPTVILYSEDDIYEVISSVKNISTKLFKINSFFLRSSPIRELISMIQKIKKYINNNCKKVSYIKNVKYNITAMDTIDELNRINDEDNNISISNLLQATNLKSQVIGIVFNIKTNNIDEKIFLPTYPSKINKEYPFSFLSEMGFNLPSPSYRLENCPEVHNKVLEML